MKFNIVLYGDEDVTEKSLEVHFNKNRQAFQYALDIFLDASKNIKKYSVYKIQNNKPENILTLRK